MTVILMIRIVLLVMVMTGNSDDGKSDDSGDDMGSDDRNMNLIGSGDERGGGLAKRKGRGMERGRESGRVGTDVAASTSDLLLTPLISL